MRPGTIGLTRIGGLLGVLVSFGQWLIGDGSRYTHVFVVVDNGEVVEAAPLRARIRPLSHFLGSEGSPLAFGNSIPLTASEREAIVYHARSLVGTRYGFANYFSIALLRLGIRPKWLRDYVASERSMICSQLADVACARAGIQLFDDGRLSGDVTPGDIANALIERDWTDRTMTMDLSEYERTCLCGDPRPCVDHG